MINPKILKVSGTIFDSIEGSGINIHMKNAAVSEPGVAKESTKKIYLEDNKFQYCTFTALAIEGYLTHSKLDARIYKCRFYNN